MKIKSVFILLTVFFALAFCGAVSADPYLGGDPPVTVQNGIVSGGLYSDSYYGFNGTSAEGSTTQPGVNLTYNFKSLPDNAQVVNATLYTGIYLGNMQSDYPVDVNLTFNGEQIASEHLNSTYNLPKGSEPSSSLQINDHVNRVTSDYLLWYDVTSRVQQNNTVNLINDPNNFDGRIRFISLIVAYNDGDNDKIMYWVNQGHDTDSFWSEQMLGVDYVGQSNFTSTLPLNASVENASLEVGYIASENGAYAFNSNILPASSPQGSYSGSDTWNVTGNFNKQGNNTFTYDKTGNFYKIVLALLTVQYAELNDSRADLFTSNLVAPSSPVMGETYPVNVTVTNNGLTNANTFSVKLYDNNVQVAKTILAGLASGVSSVVNLSWTPAFSGSHVLAVIADANNQINESDESNNRLSSTVTVNSSTLPDLTMNDLVVPSSPVVGVGGQVIVKVMNLGNADAGAFVVKLYDNNVQVAKITLAGLAAGASTPVTFSWIALTSGPHNLFVKVDANNQVTELNENNNQISQQTTTMHILYVNGLTGNDNWDGTSSTYIDGTRGPMKTIQTAINALKAGGIINIASGLYSGVNNTNITLNKDMTIIGQSKDGTIINGTNTASIFMIINNANVILKNLTLTNGQTAVNGGAIYNNGGNLTIINCTLKNNTATNGGGAIYNSGNLTVTDSSVYQNTATKGNGGGIYNSGTLTLTDSSVYANSATLYSGGGGIYNDGTMAVTDSSVYNNSATWGGGIVNFESGTMTLTNSRVYDNTAYAGAGGIYNGKTNAVNMTLINSSIYNNTATNGDGGGIINFSGTLLVTNSSVYNNTAAWYGAGIRNYYGTLTVTNSSVYNNSARQYGGAGIYNCGTVTVTDSSICNNSATQYGGGIYNDRYGTVNLTNSSVDNNTATNGGAIYNESILTVSNCTLTQNAANDGYGGAIYNDQNLNVNGSVFNCNTAFYGGAIYSAGNTSEAPLNITNSTFKGNNASWNGGALYNTCDLILTDTTFANNHINNNTSIWDVTYIPSGGAIYNTGNLTLIRGNFTNNTAGWWGGAVYNKGNLTVTGTIFTGNQVTNQEGGMSVLNGEINFFPGGGAIYNTGNLTLDNSIFTQNSARYGHGGAICNAGNMSATNNSFDSDIATFGGAINNWGNLTLNNTTFTGNSALYYGGGGALYNFEGGNSNVFRSLFINNTTSNGLGGAIYNQGNLNVDESTFTGNTATSGGRGGVIANRFGTATLRNCRIIGNTAYYNSVESIYSTGGNVDVSCNWWGSNNPDFSSLISGTVNYSPWIYMTLTATPTTINNTKTSLITANFNNLFDGITITDLNPTLGHIPNGSPVTFQTDRGNVGSKIMDSITTDGIAIVTLTANETPGTAHLNATTDTQTAYTNVLITPQNLIVNSNMTNEYIQAVIDSAGMGDTVTFLTGTYNNIALIITRAMALVGDETILNGSETAPALNISGDASGTKITGFTIISGLNGIYITNSIGNTIINDTIFLNGTSNSGALYNEGNLTVTNSIFTGNTANQNGGAIYNAGNLTVTDSYFTDNAVLNWYCGAICNVGILTVTDSVFTGSTGIIGGAIFNSQNSISTVTGCTFIDNTATNNGYGGAIANYPDGMVIVSGCTFINNTATSDSGAIRNAGTLTVNDSIFINNTSRFGAAIYNWDSLTVNNSTFINNTASEPGWGGAIYNGGTSIINNSNFIGNTANNIGGAIANLGSLNIDECSFVDNSASRGGAIGNNDGSITISDSTFTDNTASTGGAMDNRGSLTVMGSICTDNTANYGGAIYSNGNSAVLNVDKSLFLDNSARSGGAITNGGHCNVLNSNFTNNNATDNDGSGGAICNGGTLTVSDSNLTSNTANKGGAIENDGTLTVTCSNFTNNTANAGSAIYTLSEQAQIKFNRIVNNTGTNDIYGRLSGVNATNNWWGTNFQGTNPLDTGRVNINVNVASWLYMAFTTNSKTILNGSTTSLNTSLSYVYDGTTITDLDPASGHLPNGLDVVFASDSLGSINPQTSETLNGISKTTYIAGVLLGISTVNATLDSQTVSTSLTIVKPFIDLMSLNIQIPTNPYLNNTYNVTVTMLNNGTVNADSFVVKLYDNNVQKQKITLNGLGAGQSTIVIFNWTPTTIGNHVLSIRADANNQVTEKDETNNQITNTTSAVEFTRPDITVSNLVLPDNPEAGTTYTVTATVSNTGNASAGTFAVKLYDNNVQKQKITLSGLGAGESTTVTFNWTPTTSGNHNLTVITDANQQITEKDETNNQITGRATVT